MTAHRAFDESEINRRFLRAAELVRDGKTRDEALRAVDISTRTYGRQVAAGNRAAWAFASALGQRDRRHPSRVCEVCGRHMDRMGWVCGRCFEVLLRPAWRDLFDLELAPSAAGLIQGGRG